MSTRKWALVMAGIAVGGPLCQGLRLSFRLPDILEALVSLAILLAGLGYLVAAIASVGTGIALACQGRRRAVLPCLILPAAIAMLALVPGLYRSIIQVADYVHLATFSVRYVRAVAVAPRMAGPRFVWFLWKIIPGTLGPDTNVILVFDESDGWALSQSERSGPWQDRAALAFSNLTGSWMAPPMPDEAHHLLGHWYVVRITY